jgi:hypothetical protein
MFDGMTIAEAEAFVENVLSKSPYFERVGDNWRLNPKAAELEIDPVAILLAAKPEGHG